MIKRLDRDMLSEAYGQVSKSVTGPPAMLGRPVMITMDMPGAKAYEGDSEGDCGCNDHHEHDHEEVSMACGDLAKLADIAPKLSELIQSKASLEGWVASKITIASDYIASIFDYMQYSGDQEHEGNMYTGHGAEDHDDMCPHAAEGCKCGGCTDCQ